MSNRIDRKRKLLDSAQTLIARDGYHSTKVSSIVKHAEVAQGTFYWHFKNKSAIMLEILNEGEQMLMEVIKQGYRKTPGSIEDMILSSEKLMTDIFTFVKENSEFLKLLLESGRDVDRVIQDQVNNIHYHMEDAFKQNILRAKEFGMLKNTGSTDMQAIMLTSFVRGIMHRWLFDDEDLMNLNPQELAKEVVQFEFFGLHGGRIASN
ncbi:TetR/AcrR family transcriptional regulator [Alkalicoccobacillus murimartini]|uniref:AcrR family transcriptional regulator n=1 Tax=Alkalicoccobacillus murimartini TaxID=171685 RepID=A0ABT9YMQ8_9BACI|nr:TetR/AcrR family transcriptional regulator [Alkalicoccobacillus murimartini]MDQ0209170.1 AcrR family transcriptional regulator [Alkalicoccobacillus murimartini]